MKKILYCVSLLWAPIFACFAQNPVVIENQKVTIASIGNTNYELKNKGELQVSNPSITTIGTINFTNDSAWLILDGVLPSVAISSHLNYILVNGQPAVNKINVRVTNYLQGCVILPHATNFEALSIYKDEAFGGDVMKCIPLKYYKSAELLSFEDTTSSFKLKKGYMATFAQNENGTGYSKVYIADKEDIEISTLPIGLNNLVSFVRVFPWRYTTKKGFGAGFSDFNRSIKPAQITNCSWFYNWGVPTTEDLTDFEFVTMKSYASSFTEAKWQEIVDLNYCSHLLGYNEPNNSGPLNMTVKQQLKFWPKFMESGMRLGSPAPTDWDEFFEFMDKCDQMNYRVDFVCIHDYGEGTADTFYRNCKRVFDRTKRPIWITEFNWGGPWTKATPTYPEIGKRIGEVIARFDKEGIVERYAIFNFDEELNREGKVQNRAVFFTPAIPEYRITAIGEAYRDGVSTMAFNPAGQINIPLKLETQQYIEIKNTNAATNILSWDKSNTGFGTIFIERSFGSSPYSTIAQLPATATTYSDDVSKLGFGRYNYRLTTKQLGFANSTSAVITFDVNPNTIFNVALNKPTVATSVHSTATLASNAVDGNITSDSSRWVTKSGGLPANIEIDLSGSFAISELKFYSGYLGYNSPISSFEFQYWNEDRWETLITETSNTAATYSKTFTEVTTNKVRLVVNAAHNNVARFYEIEVYGRITSLGIEDFSKSKFNIFPNPATEIINISSEILVSSVVIYDINSKVVLTHKDSNSINISPLSKGVYFVKINNAETIKFVKN